ncbi:MAG: thiamine pyrophosphate-binding protein [Vampirovibrionales bacterium]
MLKVSDYIAQRLKQVYGAEHVFMVSGGGAMHLNDSLGQHLNVIANHHEQACAMAAEGYARVNQRLAVVNVTTGPGGINALNGVFGQWTDSVPVLYLSGQVKYSTTLASCSVTGLRQLGDQEADTVRLVEPLVKYVTMVTDPQSIRYHLDKAIYLATHGRFGPVWLDIPLNVQAALIDPDTLPAFTPEAEANTQPSTDIHTQVESILHHLQHAKRPVIVAGHGVRLSHQVKTLHTLLVLTQAPVLTTFNGMDTVADDHPQWIGRIGTIGQRAGNFALQNADVVLCLGTRNNIRQASYNYENFAKNALKIVVDVDPAELQKPTVIPDVPLCADLAELLPALVQRLQTTPNELARPEWLHWCQARKEAFSHANTPDYQQQSASVLNPYHVVRTLSEAVSDDALWVMANGSACVCSFQTAKVQSTQQRFILNSGNASMGFDLPAAIGASLEAKGRPVICLAGDGSIMMNLQELETLRYHQLPIKLVVLQNQGYASIKNTQRNFFNGRMTASTACSGVSVPDFVKLAEAFGLPAVRIDSPNGLAETLAKVLATPGPVVCEVVMDADYNFSPKLSARQLPDGTMVSPSLEDMAPFLDRAEFAKHQWPTLTTERTV